MNREMRLGLSILITVVVIGIILGSLDLNKIASVLSKLKIEYFALAMMIYLILNIAMSARIRSLLTEMKQEISLIDCIRANFGGMIASDFTPARSGYFLTAFIISSNNKIDLDKTLISIFGPQLIEFAIKVICTAILAFIVIGSFGGSLGNWNLYLIIVLAVVSAIIAFFWLLLFVKGLLEKFEFMKKLPLANKVFYLLYLMRSNSDTIMKRKYEVFGLTFLTWLLKGTEWYLLAKALNIVVFDPMLDFGFFLLFHSFLTFTNFLPLPTLAGTGASEAAAAGVFVLFGLSVESGVAFALLARFLMVAVDLIGLSAIVPLLKKESLDQLLGELENVEKRSKA
ncbi:flippase-like domain-containing protein [Candidatus Micrarchaeota archaeon]|nr:flippase-like domain-containing protein [Candidatus Micrarchaeota archaeon]